MTTHQDHTSAHHDDDFTQQQVPQPGDSDIRWDLVAKMKELIAAGQLDTPERWNLAEHFLHCAIEEKP